MSEPCRNGGILVRMTVLSNGGGKSDRELNGRNLVKTEVAWWECMGN